jgi:hypothetical protein
MLHVVTMMLMVAAVLMCGGLVNLLFPKQAASVSLWALRSTGMGEMGEKISQRPRLVQGFGAVAILMSLVLAYVALQASRTG